jgi:hypothetical protein
MFSRYFIWKKAKKHTLFKILFGERLFQCFLDILFGKKQKNILYFPLAIKEKEGIKS